MRTLPPLRRCPNVALAPRTRRSVRGAAPAWTVLTEATTSSSPGAGVGGVVEELRRSLDIRRPAPADALFQGHEPTWLPDPTGSGGAFDQTGRLEPTFGPRKALRVLARWREGCRPGLSLPLANSLQTIRVRALRQCEPLVVLVRARPRTLRIPPAGQLIIVRPAGPPGGSEVLIQGAAAELGPWSRRPGGGKRAVFPGPDLTKARNQLRSFCNGGEPGVAVRVGRGPIDLVGRGTWLRHPRLRPVFAVVPFPP